MSPNDPNELIRPPNDGAYEVDEVRTGPPLSYVAEKFRRNLEAVHGLIQEIRRPIPGDFAAHELSPPRSASAQEKYFQPLARCAFRSAVVGYLDLNNMLALANEDDLDDRLLAFSRREFQAWLDGIDQAGSVTG